MGPQCRYAEIHSHELQNFINFVTDSWIYETLKAGFDTSFQGAKNQPWHRDFLLPPETFNDWRMISLAFNLTGLEWCGNCYAISCTSSE